MDIATFIAANRFGLGIGRDDAKAIGSDPKTWVNRQIRTAHTLPDSLAGFPSSAAIVEALHGARLESAEELRKMTRRHYRKTFMQEVSARVDHMARSDQPFAERMVLFWSNHFSISRTKAIVGPIIPAYEREAIRPHIFGRFEDMLQAVAGHVAMISYLDNNLSIGPRSKAARRSGRSLNENLAREILELHTLGVDGGYNQGDVTEFAKALTGWSHGAMGGRRRKRKISGQFVFRAATHEPGPKTVLGKTYPEDGVNEGKAILGDLARHESTAKFIATKLVRHFVADDPPARAVEQIAQVFLATKGDLAAVSRALADLDSVWSEPLPKVKTPYELVVSTWRALGLENRSIRAWRLPLRLMGHEPFNAPSPQGWPDEARHWVAPEALMRRIEWVRAVAARAPSTSPPSELLERLLGPVASPELRRMVELAPSGDAGTALVLASAEFQRR